MMNTLYQVVILATKFYIVKTLFFCANLYVSPPPPPGQADQVVQSINSSHVDKVLSYLVDLIKTLFFFSANTHAMHPQGKQIKVLRLKDGQEPPVGDAAAGQFSSTGRLKRTTRGRGATPFEITCGSNDTVDHFKLQVSYSYDEIIYIGGSD